MAGVCLGWRDGNRRVRFSDGVGLSWVTGSDWIRVCEVPESRQEVVIVLT